MVYQGAATNFYNVRDIALASLATVMPKLCAMMRWNASPTFDEWIWSNYQTDERMKRATIALENSVMWEHETHNGGNGNGMSLIKPGVKVTHT